MSTPLFVLQFDEAYQKWGAILIESLAKHHPNIAVVLAGIAFSKDTINMFQDKHPNIIIENDSIETNCYQLPFEKKPLKELMACRKAFVMADIMKRYDSDIYVMLDADCLVRKPLDTILNRIQKNTIGVTSSPQFNHMPTKKYNTSLVIAHHTAQPVIELWASYEQRQRCSDTGLKQWDWYWDQLCFYHAIKDASEITIISLSEQKYINTRFDSKAIIWSAHIDKECQYSIFLKELKGETMTFTIEDAYQYYKSMKWGMAYIACEYCLEKSPHDERVLFLYAGLDILNNNIYKAQKIYQQIKAINPKFKGINDHIDMCEKRIQEGVKKQV